VISWNVHVGGGNLRALIDDLRSGQVTGQPVRDFVLLLQEVHRTGATIPPAWGNAPIPRRIGDPLDRRRLSVEVLAEALGLHLFYVPSMRNGREAPGMMAEDRGNAILSTRPLTELAVLELPFVRQRRVAIAATIQGIGTGRTPGRLRVASGHLDATAGAGRLWVFSSETRTRQARALAAWLDGDVPAVVGSDLNTWAGGSKERAYTVLRQAFASGPGALGLPTFRLGWELDHLFFRLPSSWPAPTLQRLDHRYESDHYPVLGIVDSG
jgi:endonuclease/exonuclease/phosphatase family metal-dependent hydrolase